MGGQAAGMVRLEQKEGTPMDWREWMHLLIDGSLSYKGGNGLFPLIEFPIITANMLSKTGRRMCLGGLVG